MLSKQFFKIFFAISLLIALLLSPFFIGAAKAEPAKKTLNFGIMALAPYGFQGDGEKWRGNFYEVAKAIVKEGGFEGTVRVLPVPRISHEAIKGRTIDCTITAQVPFMEKNYKRIAHLGESLTFGVLTLPGLELKSYDDLKEVSVVVPIGAKMGSPFDQDKSLNKVPAKDYVTAMLMLERGRVDAAVGVIDSLKFSANSAGIKRTHYSPPLVFKTLPLNVYCAPFSHGVTYALEIQKAVERLAEKDTISKIFKYYRGELTRVSQSVTVGDRRLREQL